MVEHDVVVRGQGAVGRAAALALARQGLSVALQATAPPAAAAQSDVRAYALNAASVDLLSALKVWEALPAGARTAVHDMRICGDQRHQAEGGQLEFSAWQQGVAELAWIVDAAALEATLQSACRFAPHINLVNEPGATPQAALKVLAEGRDSSTRAALGVQWTRHAYGHQGIAARLRCEQPHQGVARQWFRSPDVLALLPLDLAPAGWGYGLVWSVPEARAQELLGLDEAAFAQALMAATGGAVGSLTLASPRQAWPLTLGRASAVSGPGWVLVGDAAHVVHPLAGQGLNLGLADVATLAQVLQARERFRSLGDERLLARYARQRWAPTQAMASVTDGLLHLFAHTSPAAHWLRNRGLSLVDRAGPLKKLLVGRALGA